MGRLGGLGVSRPTPVGVLRPTPGGQGQTQRGVSQQALRQTPPQQTATAVGSTHPTGMNSCYLNRFSHSPSHFPLTMNGP